MADVRVSHSPSEERYVLTVDGDQAGYIDYLDEIDVRVLTATVVQAPYAGNGYAAQLAKYALDDIRSEGKHARTVCTYVADYVAKHPEYADMTSV
ncbi:GNAT family N-acetyltransferase [Tsukamurella sp. 8F]|uniref:GNAT family N-acetyltransferase n=1 Tax=unclassified Tsukamurella TaxID=2633480 RepID=UPI0023B8C94D|nr:MULTISPECIES: GNAT family N-acetyltransferase [unclassified Tsukamurella]MDF0531699.1 GNAT family N-acetyltransferase [Tsukamurella sp. 8J]MDF0588945.1 GNAT family N-acetyltransferase [Tsukamurella sp. 8F]